MIVVYNKATGEITKTVTAPESEAKFYIGSGEAYLLTDSPTENCRVVNKKLKQIPQAPSVFHTWNPQSKTWECSLTKAWEQVKRDRSALLSRCDWTQISDVALTEEKKAAWAAYRQALRDITMQKDPLNIVWPSSPR